MRPKRALDLCDSKEKQEAKIFQIFQCSGVAKFEKKKRKEKLHLIKKNVLKAVIGKLHWLLHLFQLCACLLEYR